MILILILAALLLGTNPVVAEEGSQPLRLSLSEAIDLAVDQNLEVRLSRQSVEVARSSISIAEQRPNPTLNIGSPIGPAERKQRLIFTVPLETGGRRQARLQVASSGVREAEINEDLVRITVANQVRNAFIEVAISEAGVRQVETDLQFYERLVDNAKKRFESGDVAEAEIFRAEFERDQILRSRFPAKNRFRTSLLTLNRLLGLPIGTQLTLAGQEELFPDAAQLRDQRWQLPPLSSLLELAYESRPDLALSRQRLESAQRRIQLAKANRSPDVSLQGTLLWDPVYPAFTYMVGLQFELPWGSDRKGELQQAQAQELEALYRQNIAVADAELAVAGARTKLETAIEQVRHDLEILKPQSERVLHLAERIYEIGQGDISEVILAGQSVQRQRRAYLDDVALLHQAVGELELAVNTRLNLRSKVGEPFVPGIFETKGDQPIE